MVGLCFSRSPTQRPDFSVVNELISSYTQEPYSQEKLAENVLDNSAPQSWIKDFILSEMKRPLFVRMRLLDCSKTNKIIKDLNLPKLTMKG